MLQMLKLAHKTKCDFPGCKLLADCAIFDEVDADKKLNLCSECVVKIYECVAKTVIPKGVESPFKKQRKLR